MSTWQDDSRPWSPESESGGPAPVTQDPAAFEPYAVVEALRALGVLKPDERPVVSHKYGCPFPKDYSATCTCPPLPGSTRRTWGAEIQFPDWDETKPLRHYTTPERFCER